MNEREILEILADWNYWGNFKENPHPRPTYLSRLGMLYSGKTALVLLGVRRAGKSSITYLFINELVKQKRLAAEDCLIINFEDPRFPATMDSKALNQIYETYLKHLDPSNPLVILDEIQNIRYWEKFVRYLLESQKVHVMVTGSSSKLLGKEISTVLTGRHVDLEVFPLSFQEFLDFKGLHVSSKLEITKLRLEIRRLFDEYAQWGGFPEVIFASSQAHKQELLRRYFEDIVFKDVVKRYGIKEIHKLEELANLYLTNISTLQSFNKLKGKTGASLDTVQRFSNYLETARVFFFLRKFDYSLAKQIRSMRKVYVIDLGFYRVKGFRFSENYGRIAENLVAIELLRKCSADAELEVFYWKDDQQREVDFVVKKSNRITALIQVCWDFSDAKTKAREIKSLLKASEALNCDNLFILTENFDDVETITRMGVQRTIRFLSLWRWLVEESVVV